jgi:hypothetical protein
MDLRTLNTLKVGDRIRFTKNYKDVGIRPDMMGTVTAIARGQEEPEFPTVYIQPDSPRPDLLDCENELMLTWDSYCDPTDETRDINSRIDPDSIVACMEKTDMPRAPADEQGLRWIAARSIRFDEDKAA